MTSRPTPVVLTLLGLLLLVVFGRLVGGAGPSLVSATAGAPAPEPATQPSPSSEPTAPPEQIAVTLEPVALTVDAVEARSPGGVLTAVPDDVQRAVVGVLEQYVTAATLDPLAPPDTQSGIDLAGLFTEATRSRVDGPDRAALVDEGLPLATGGASADRAAVSLTALADADGTIHMVTAALDLQIRAHTADGPILITRTGEMVVVPEADTWRINAYRLNVRRELGGDAAAQAGL